MKWWPRRKRSRVEVRFLPYAEADRQSELLDQAATEGWTSKHLRSVVKGTTGASERISLAELGDALVTATLALLRNLPPGAGGDLLRDCVWTAADAWLARRGREPARR